MVRTRVGYAGGSAKNPTYRNLGDHTEAVQIDYDPSQISFSELLDVFWSAHDATSRPWSRQYKAAVFHHTEEQRLLALASRDREAAKVGVAITTEVLPYTGFYRAEDYHQKYRLQQDEALTAELEAKFPSFRGFVDSTASARLNGYLGGYGSLDVFRKEIDQFGLSSEGRERLVQTVSSSRPAFRACSLK